MQSTIDCSTKIATVREWLCEADAILVGIGSGLSAAGGLDYGSSELMQKWYPEYFKHGVRSIMDMLSLYWPNTVTDENATQYYGVWARHILNIRYETPLTKPYHDLAQLLNGKPHFIITTNADGQAQKAGFDHEIIFAPQGNYAYFQCKTPCSDEIYENEIMVRRMVKNMLTPFEIRKEDIPHCPNCGDFLIPNLRADHSFVEALHLVNYPKYEQFIQENQTKRLLFLELGVGFNTPTIIRYPFESMTAALPNAHLIRINSTHPEVPPEITEKSIAIDRCLSVALGELCNTCDSDTVIVN